MELQQEIAKLKHRPTIANRKTMQPIEIVRNGPSPTLLRGTDEGLPSITNVRRQQLQTEYGQQLHQECKSPKIDVLNLRRIVSTNPDSVRYPSSAKNEYALHILCQNKKTTPEMVYLIATEFRLAARHADNTGSMPLHHACESRLPYNVIQYVMELYEGANNIPNDLGMWPIHIACLHECHADVIRHMLKVHPQLLKKRTKCGRLAIHLAADFPKRSIFEPFVEINTNILQEVDREEGNTTLHIACENNASFDCIEHLCYGYLPAMTMANHKGDLPLHMVLKDPKHKPKTKLKIVTHLVQSHWNATNTPNRNGNLPIHIACGNKASLKIIEYLGGVNPESLKAQTTKYGMTPLHVACQVKSSTKVITYLIGQYKAALVIPTQHKGQLPIHLAASKRAKLDVIKLLARRSPDSLERKDHNGKTPSNLAAEAISAEEDDEEHYPNKKKDEEMLEWLSNVTSGNLPLGRISMKGSLRMSMQPYSLNY